jgi:8-oxo-dGTP diphosphatase
MDISDQNTLLSLQAQAEAEERQCVVGALIRNAQGNLLVQKRAPTRKLYPGCWDIIGGHVEVGESLTTALAREIHEETGWKLARIVTLLDVCDWQAEQGACKREFDFLVEIEGDLEHPELERSKHTAFRWVDLAGLDLLKEQRLAGDDLLYQIVKRALEWAPGQSYGTAPGIAERVN